MSSHTRADLKHDERLFGPPPTAEAPRGGSAPGSTINPYALAELVAGQPIDWKHTERPAALVEQLLGAPCAELFDPAHGGPLYLGAAAQEGGGYGRARSPLLDRVPPGDGNDFEQPPLAELGGAATLADVMRHFEGQDFLALPVGCIDWSVASRLKITLALPEVLRQQHLARTYSPDLVRTISHDSQLKLGNNQPWSPPGGTWQDGGRFFNETAEFFDPVQGAVANCYYIAALSALAWAAPFRISHHTRATGLNQAQYVNRVTFFRPDSGGQVDREIEVTDLVPRTAGGSFIYCRSSEADECWPAIYEKAFAKLVTNNNTDQPDITATGWGDCVWATAQLTGGARAYYDTASRSDDQLWNLLRSHCMSYRTIRPMTAWTYGSGADSPDKVVYADANVVGSHCYTVLGWAYRHCKRYILLRNPWGHTEVTASALDATVQAWDVSWWRPIALKDVDGTFAMEIGAFKRYFAGFGVVS